MDLMIFQGSTTIRAVTSPLQMGTARLASGWINAQHRHWEPWAGAARASPLREMQISAGFRITPADRSNPHLIRVFKSDIYEKLEVLSFDRVNSAGQRLGLFSHSSRWVGAGFLARWFATFSCQRRR